MSSPIGTILKSGICRTNTKIQRPNPSLFYFPGLNSQPIHPPSNFENVVDLLKHHHNDFVDEYNQIRKSGTKSDYQIKNDEHLLHEGSWDWHSYILKGKLQSNFEKLCPKTASALSKIPRLMYNIPFSYAFFSTLSPKTVISPHYGPCNIRIRCHYPILVPKEGDCGMEVANNLITWRTGEPIFFDDCYSHHVWNRSEFDRVVLLLDLWHPDLHDEEIESIINMFSYAKSQGWIRSE